ncbi:MAG: hypothetical protein GYA23_05370 [Methanomicrobiales archaeon]|nr:hypothetical protein [Methanomicrobiales archaeon]
MAKRHVLPTRAFGAEPGTPDVSTLAAWIAEHKGRLADIMTWRVDQSLAPQAEASITMPCAGGTFYRDRILSCLQGVTGRKATGELHVDTPDIIEDAAGIVVRKKGAWCAMPAPHALGIRDEYYEDELEWNDAICSAYRTIMRAMRDTGVVGHVLITDSLVPAELASLAGKNVFYFHPSPDTRSLEQLLDRQWQVAVPADRLSRLFALKEEYTIRKVFIIDADAAAISLARQHLDPDQIVCGGYNSRNEEDYWKDLVARAVYES